MSEFDLSDDDKRELLRIARVTLREYTRTGLVPPGRPHKPALLVDAAGSVTLHSDDAVRKSPGISVERRMPLYRLVQEMAVAAAKDPSAPPLSSEELDRVDIEVALSPAPSFRDSSV